LEDVVQEKKLRVTLTPGFSLIELLVVIGIIAILIGILVPTLSLIRQSAGQIKCASILRQFADADQMYLNEWKDFHLPAFLGNTREASNMWSANVHFRRALNLRTIELNEVAVTPPGPPPTPGRTSYAGYLTKGWLCPQATRLLDRVVTNDKGEQLFPPQPQYGMNVEGISADPNLVPQPTRWAVPDDPALGSKRGSGCYGYKRAQVRRSAEKLRFADGMTINLVGGPGVLDKSGSGAFPGTNGKVSNYDQVQERVGGVGTLPDGTAFDATRMTVWRHKGGANVAFFDGHCQWLRKDEIYTRDDTGKIVTNDKLWVVLK
jgi:prepilin-type processing-associated H-X9-DG protein/prepilin-type N-terminal cleavage/methylation domain-containing protein